jgi:hypothetical protein
VFISFIGAIVAGIRHLENTRFLLLFTMIMLSVVFYFCETLPQQPCLTGDPENKDTGAYILTGAGSLFLVCAAYVVFRHGKNKKA